MIEWGKHQQDIANWKAAIMPKNLNTPWSEYKRSQEEMRELRWAICTDSGTQAASKEIGGEAVDVIIRMLGIASLVECNVRTTLDEKIKVTTQEKYHPDKINSYIAAGLTWSEAMHKAKTDWTTTNP